MSWYRHDLVTGWGGSALVTEKNTGIIEKKERRDISTTHHWSVRNSIGTEENMESYHQQIFSIKLQRLAENCIFFELSERRVQFAPECFETELHSADTNLMASSVSGIGRENEKWHGITSSGESSLQHPAIRNNPPGFSVIFSSQRWVEMIQMSWIEMNDWPRTTETES